MLLYWMVEQRDGIGRHWFAYGVDYRVHGRDDSVVSSYCTPGANMVEQTPLSDTSESAAFINPTNFSFKL